MAAVRVWRGVFERLARPITRHSAWAWAWAASRTSLVARCLSRAQRLGWGWQGGGGGRADGTYDGVKEEVGVIGVADADTTRSGLLRGHGRDGRDVGARSAVVVVVVVLSKAKQS